MSSTRIRAMLEAGDVAAACEALGRPFALSGVVVHGDGRGRSIGIPTANLETDERLALPGTGVYAAIADHRRHHLQGGGQRRSPPHLRR